MVSKDTLIATAYGKLRISSLLNQPELMIFSGNGYRYVVASPVCGGAQPVFAVCTREKRRILVTASQCFLTLNRGDVPVMQLNTQDLLITGPSLVYRERPIATHDQFTSVQAVGTDTVFTFSEIHSQHYGAGGLVIHI